MSKFGKSVRIMQDSGALYEVYSVLPQGGGGLDLVPRMARLGQIPALPQK